MIPKAERDADAAILAAATPDWQQGHHVGEPKGLCSAQSPDESLLMLDKDGMAIFWKEPDAVAAVHCRNRLPAYIAALDEMERRIAGIEAWHKASTDLEHGDPDERAEETLATVLEILRGGQ